MPKLAKEKCLSELKKLKSMSPMSAEATVVRNYLDWMTELPWSNKSKINTDLNNAQKTLDEDHYGLEKVKERIIEFLAVQKRMQKMKGPILSNDNNVKLRYVVDMGDTIRKISQGFEVSQKDLLAENGIRSSKSLKAGTNLTIYK